MHDSNHNPMTTGIDKQCQHEYLRSGGGVPRNCIHCDEPEFTLGQKSKTIMSNQSAEEIVNDNFKGLDELIEDKDVLQFYKDLIVACIESYHTSKLSPVIAQLQGELKLVHIAHDFQADIVKQQNEICKKLLEEIYSIRSELSRLKVEKEGIKIALVKYQNAVDEVYNVSQEVRDILIKHIGTLHQPERFDSWLASLPDDNKPLSPSDGKEGTVSKEQ